MTASLILLTGVAWQYATPDRPLSVKERRVIEESQKNSRYGVYWPVSPLRDSDPKSAAIRLALVKRFRGVKSREEAARVAEPFLRGPFASREAVYKGALSLYYLRMFGGRSDSDPIARRIWPAFVKLGDHGSPEHARAACDFAEATNHGRIRYKTAVATLKRYGERSDGIWLAFRVSYSAAMENNIPGLISVADWAHAKRNALSTEVVMDGYGKGTLPRIMLLSLEANAIDTAARETENRKLGQRAVAGFDELLKDPATPKAVRELAKNVREGLLERRFMR